MSWGRVFSTVKFKTRNLSIGQQANFTVPDFLGKNIAEEIYRGFQRQDGHKVRIRICSQRLRDILPAFEAQQAGGKEPLQLPLELAAM